METEGHAALVRVRNLIDLRRFSEALAALPPAFADPATAPEAHCRAAQSLIELNRPREALAAADQAVALDPQDEWPHRLRAIALLRRAKHKAALAAAEEAAHLNPHEIQVMNVLAICQVNRRKKEEASRTAAAALAAHPHAPLAHKTAGIVASAQNHQAEAEEHLRAALRLDPNDASVATLLASVLKQRGNKREAGEVLLAAARVDPTSSDTRRALGQIGLPVAAVSGFAALKAVLAVQGARLFSHAATGVGVAIVALLFLVVGGGLTLARVRGTRHLPEHIRAGLMDDHRNYALAWLGASAPIALLFAVFAQAGETSPGSALALTLGLVAWAGCAVGVTRWLWAGPLPRLLTPTRWFARSRSS